MGIVEHLHPSLATLEYTQTSVKLKLVTGSFFFFASIYILSHFGSNIFQTYRNSLRMKEKIFWNLAIMRGVYGCFCIIVGLWAIFIDTELSKDVVFATTPTSYFALCITVGFFIFECSMLLWSDIHFKQFNFLLNLHHWLSLVGYSIILVVESTHYFGTRGLILEMSTPFSCLCWTLLKSDMAHTLLWKANQFFLVHTFHLRSVVECNMWYLTYLNWERIWTAMPTSMFALLYTQLVLVTLVMTPYWTYKKTAQMINPVDWNFEDANKTKQTNGKQKSN